MPFKYSQRWLRRFATLLLLVIQYFLVPPSSASDDATTFLTPSALQEAKMDNRDDALALLRHKPFLDALYKMAMALPDDTVSEQSHFNYVALLSIRNQHETLIESISTLKNGVTFTHYRLDSEVKLGLKQAHPTRYQERLNAQFTFEAIDATDERLYQLNSALGWSVENAQDYAFNLFKHYRQSTKLSIEEAVDLIVNVHLYTVLQNVIPVTQTVLKRENHKRYDIQPEVLITTDNGAELAVTIVRRKGDTHKRPAAFQFTIYADETAHIRTAMYAAVRGYVGVVANTRGKRSSSNQIVPWEYDGQDGADVVNWIAEQTWSTGDVLMYGGSYNGFTQWAIAKHMPKALKAIAPYTAASLITGLPYENNIVLIGNYEWPFFVTNNKTLDNNAYADWQVRRTRETSFYESGLSISDLEKIDGRPNPWLQKWLAHPSFDQYYAAMVPVRDDYKAITIPVLTVTGYFDGGQISAMDYLSRHYRYNPDADHTLLIGPYNHGTAQGIPRSHHSNYELDEVALDKDTDALVFDWFDHLMYNKPLPKLLQAKVNYQLMGSNQWRQAASYEALNQDYQPMYLGMDSDNLGYFSLQSTPEPAMRYLSQTVDMMDRKERRNQSPWPVIQDELNEPNGLVFMSEPMKTEMELAGAISGYLSISVNKRDVDVGYNFYAIDSSGKAFHLNNYRGRASYANDMSTRQLLTPNQKTHIPIVNGRMTAKLLKPGERLAIVLNVNKNEDAQVNLGSGKDVNWESQEDAGEPLIIKWHSDTRLNIPLRPYQ